MEHRSGRGVGHGRGSKHRLRLPFLLLPFAALLVLGWTSGALKYGAWWLTNTTPPNIHLVGPQSVVRGQTTVSVQLQPADRARVVEASVDGRPLTVSEPLLVDTAVLSDGDHDVSVVAEDLSWWRNRSTGAHRLRSDNTPPRLTLEPRPERVRQGATWLLRIRADEAATIQARLAERMLDIQAGDGFGWAVLGFSPEAPSTTMPLVEDGTDLVGNRAEQQAPIQVINGEFPTEEVDVSASLLPLLGLDVRAEEDRRLAPTYTHVSPAKLWDGRFLLPVQGPIITEFGAQRSYNGGPLVGHHAGVDFAAPAGRTVVAANRGRVALVDEVRLRGKVLVLDHGLGVFTTYAHLSAVDVSVNQPVERGQPIAKVGNTGLSTGPHLHWELWVRGANVNPLEWTERDVP